MPGVRRFLDRSVARAGAVFAVAGLLGSAAPPPVTAETIVQRFAPGEQPPSGTQLAPPVSAITQRTNLPSSFYVIPWFTVDLDDPGATTTLFAIRNEQEADNEVTVEYYDPSFGSLGDEFVVLGGMQVLTRNVRDAGLAESGVVSGFIRILADAPVTVDTFQITPSEAFASGGVPVDVSGGGLCTSWRSRFLLGGGFSGGTVLTLLFNQPLGPGEPSLRGTAYNEAGNEINTFSITTDEFAIQVPASDLVLPGNPFGSLTLEFLAPEEEGAIVNTGAVQANYDALGLFSVAIEGHCLDEVGPIL